MVTVSGFNLFGLCLQHVIHSRSGAALYMHMHLHMIWQTAGRRLGMSL